ncbi:uncharacterized protein DNG_01767 [Cephalotrichum gorgonifer]|uniref:DUF7907 domain-containing protein n=1 Tax=Cephalotrichum gorgonifer TaxID=2041049 RepID=A0AAE8SSL1_9PEZI|nr:uncharacterized protein DNG_01767 [Cephalotrichum gorgonifer]
MLPLLAATLLLSPALSTPPPVSTSTGFHILLLPKDASLPARSVSMIHTGAGQSRAVAGEPSPGGGDLVFYQNGASPDSTLATDILPQGFPMSILFAPPENGTDVSPADVTVSGATSGLFVDEEEYAPSIEYVDGGRFWICESWVAYYQAVYPVFSWSAGEGEAGEACVEVDVVPVCETLEDLPDGALGSHELVQEVRCFVDNGAAGEGRRSS